MKETLGFVTIILSIIGHTPYIIDTIRGKTKPHVFTWTIWSIITLLAFLGQWVKGGGAGSWGTGITGVMAILITLFAIKKGARDITLSDKIFFIGALLAIIPWYLTKDPTISVIIAATIDFSAFVPTIRKTINNPKSETLATYSINIVRHILSFIALENYNLVTLLYPAYLLSMNLVMTTIILRPYLVGKRK